MERLNDAMTICTLARPDVVTIKVDEYAELIKTQEQYVKLVDLVINSITLDSYGKPQIDFKGDDRILIGSQILEPDAFEDRITELKEAAI